MLAWIIPIEQPGGTPTPPIYYPPYPSQPPFPTHPIAPGGQPPSIWPSPGFPSHPIYNPPFPSQGPGFPTHPIAPGGGGGYPSHPIYNPPFPSQGPGFPTHPISPGGPPPGIWPNPIPGRPDNSLPGSQPGVENPINKPPGDSENWKMAYVPGVGWVWAFVPPAVPQKDEERETRE
jgi:hypothetical protein